MLHQRSNVLTPNVWKCPSYSKSYSSIKVYHSLQKGPEAHIIFKWLWINACRIRHKIFFWFLLHDRVNMRNLLRRKTMLLESYECALCNEGTEETLMHLFWDCSFALSYWDHILDNMLRGISPYDETILGCKILPKNIAIYINILGSPRESTFWAIHFQVACRGSLPGALRAVRSARTACTRATRLGGL